METKVLAEYGAVGVVLVAIIVPIVRAFIGELAANRQERKEQQQQTMTLITNHLEHSTAANRDLARAVTGMGEQVGKLCDKLDK